MNYLLEIKTGLPLDRVEESPMLMQFNVSKFNEINTALLIFGDGQMYILGGESSERRWLKFTKLKQKGVELLVSLIKNEFMILKNEDLQQSSSGNILLWESFVDNETYQVRADSGSYESLPPVFKKIDDLINQYMYRMNENDDVN